MKKFAAICLIVICSLLGVRAQSMNFDTTSISSDSTFDVVTSMDALAYSSDNSIMFKMDIPSFLMHADSIFVGYDSLPHDVTFKKAIIYSGSSRVVEVYVVSVQLESAYDIPYADYISYVDDEGFVHEIFNTLENTAILKKFSVLLATNRYPFRMME
jgi:hypothetical protein